MILPKHHTRLGWYRNKVRDKCREAYLESNSMPDDSIKLARFLCKDIPQEMKADQQLNGILASIAVAVLINLISDWIADHIRDWTARSVSLPLMNFQSCEPGYQQHFESDES